MDVNRRHLIGHPPPACRRARNVAGCRARRRLLPRRSGAMPRNLGVRPGSPDDQTKILQRAIDKAARAQVPLALPPGDYRTGMLRLQSGTQLIGVRGATRLDVQRRRVDAVGEGAGSVGAHRHHARRRRHGRCRRGAAWCIASAGATSALPIAKSPAAAATPSGSKTSPATSAATSSRGRRPRRSCRSTRRGCWSRATPFRLPTTTASKSCAPTIGDDGTLVADNRIEDIKAGRRRLRAIRQRHQRVSRGQRHRARQPDPQLRLFGGARQFRVQHPDYRQQRERRRRSGARIRNSPSRAR